MTDIYVYILPISFLLSNRKLTEIGLTEGEDEANRDPQTVFFCKTHLYATYEWRTASDQNAGTAYSGGVHQLRIGWTREGSQFWH